MNAVVGTLDEHGTPPAGSGPVLGQADFQYLRAFVLEHCGIALGEHKHQLVQGRLFRRLRALGLSNFSSYCELLRNDPHSELGELASAISTNVTSFFREAHHYDLLVNELLPRPDLLPRASALAEQLARQPSLLLRYTRVLFTQPLKRRLPPV